MILQKDLAQRLKMKKSRLSRILSGQARFSREHSREVAGITGIDRDTLLDGPKEKIIAALGEWCGEEINFTPTGRPKENNEKP